MTKQWLLTLGSSLFLLACAVVVFLVLTTDVLARNAINFSDTLSDSEPGVFSNHTLAFTLGTDIAAGEYVDLSFPPGFELLSTSSFGVRNVEMIVNGTARTATTTLSPTTDQVIITTGDAGSIRYNLNTSTGLSNGDTIQLLIGNHTSNARQAFVSTSTGTTTIDIGVLNATTTGVHKINLTSGSDATDVYTDFVVFLIEPVDIANVDTTEIVPPVLFNGAPTGTLSGTSLVVELSVETDELATCRFSSTASTSYAAMTNTFDNTGQLIHTEDITVVNDTTYTFYLRCIDDEGNFNTEDYEISFYVPAEPTGDPDPDADEDGNGNTGGGSGSGDGSGSGGSGGSSSGGGSGGGGGGSGGGSGDDDDDDEAGGFEDNGPYESGDAQVILNGYAYPGADVVVLVDGFEAESENAENDGAFSLTVLEIASGAYTFTVYATDDSGTQSTPFSTTFSVQGSRTSNISNINITPSVDVSPNPVTAGQTITLSGYTLPNAEVTIENQKDGVSQSLKMFEATSNSNGAWSVSVDSDTFSDGKYKVRARASQSGGISTSFSDYTFYTVGAESDGELNPDLNRDGSVNLIDFSILLFWWGTDGGDSDPPADINRDGATSLTDFSILLFNWTG